MPEGRAKVNLGSAALFTRSPECAGRAEVNCGEPAINAERLEIFLEERHAV